MRKPTKKSQNRAALKCWAEQVKALAHNRCEICGRTEHLDAHHLLSSKLLKIRYDIRVGVCLCKKCHKFDYYCSPHKGPIGFVDWLIRHKHEQYDYVLSMGPVELKE